MHFFKWGESTLIWNTPVAGQSLMGLKNTTALSGSPQKEISFLAATANVKFGQETPIRSDALVTERDFAEGQWSSSYWLRNLLISLKDQQSKEAN